MDLLKYIVPRIPLCAVRGILLVTVVGALVGGIYGILHDQVTYTIGKEYFTRIKFDQFHYARPPFGSPRLFVGIIGFLATWWVGALTAWVLARVSLSREGRIAPPREIAVSFCIVFLTALLAAICGWAWGLHRQSTGYADGWIHLMELRGVQDRESFMTVAYIHNSSYLGGVVGMIFGLFYLARCRRRRNNKSPLAESRAVK